MPSPARRFVRVARSLGHRIRGDAAWYRDALRTERTAEEEVRRSLSPGLRIRDVLDAVREGHPGGFPPHARAARAVSRALESRDPEWVPRTLADADDIAHGVVRLLGADRVQLAAHSSDGSRFPWHRDVLNGYDWRPRTPARFVAVAYDRADIKVPWELSRFQHLPTLGMAYAASSEERYAATLVAQIDDWLVANPTGYGVNWACTMDVAIRAVNWLWSLRLMSDATALSDAFLVRLLAGLLAHGRHIASNIETYAGGITTNHTLADYAGLYYLGALVPWFNDAQGWEEQGRKGVLECMRQQVAPDGVDFENSVPYHRLVAEMLIDAYLLAETTGKPFRREDRQHLERMIEFVLHYVRPDGLAPLVGDSDDARLRILSRYFDWEPQDHRYLLAVGAELFDRDDFATVGREPVAGIEEVAWLLGPGAAQSLLDRPPHARVNESVAFRESGRYVIRRAQDWAFICADEVGTGGLGNHKHNDVLSFELAIEGTPVVIDRGSYLYTSDLAWRDRFRSTRAHSTVMVDGREQNEFAGSFGMRADASVTVRSWYSGPHADVFVAEHDGYRRLPDPVTHVRTIVRLESPRAWVVADRIEGSDAHRIESFLHLAPGELVGSWLPLDEMAGLATKALDAFRATVPAVQLPTPQAHHALAYTRGAVTVVVVPVGGDTVAVHDGWLAPRYGQRVRAPFVELSARQIGDRAYGFLIIVV